MSQQNVVSHPALPSPLHWRGTPVNWKLDANSVLEITAGQRTDWFIDPGGTANVNTAPALLMDVKELCQLKALVTVDYASTFDAGVLTVYKSEQLWAKLCLELSPQGTLMIVSVVTKGKSDDCNSVPISGKSAYLRIAKLESAYAFHYSLDGSFWNMVRYFTLDGSPEAEIGFLAQSPTGEKCSARFSEVAYVPQKLAEIRTGV